MVAGTSKAARILRIIFCEPLKSLGRTWWWVTLHRPPPAMRIFAPSVFAPSRMTMRKPAGAVSAAKMAAASPAAPPPTIARSAESSFTAIDRACWALLVHPLEPIGKLWAFFAFVCELGDEQGEGFAV